jgi:hypothetical protein
LLVLLGASVALAVTPAGAQDTVRFALRWEITEGTSVVAESIGVLTGIAVDRAGNVYVSDRGATKVWVFDPDGRPQRAIGRKGKGPGEFESPTGLGIGLDGRLWVRDVDRVSRFTTDAATGRLTRFEASFVGPAIGDWMSDRATRFRPDGAMLYPEFGVMYREQPAPRTGRYIAFDASGGARDSIDVPTFANAPASYARVSISPRSGRMLHGLNHVPFAPIPVWDATTRGTVLAGDGDEYLIRELDRDRKIVREYRRSVTPTRVPAAERRDSTNALRARIDSLRYARAQVLGVPDDVWALRLPEVYPPYAAVYGGVDGRVWVRRWVPDGARRSVFDVFEPDGRFRAVVEIPREVALLPTPWLSLDGIAAVGVDRETGAHTILRFLPGPR